MALRYRRS